MFVAPLSAGSHSASRGTLTDARSGGATSAESVATRPGNSDSHRRRGGSGGSGGKRFRASCGAVGLVPLSHIREPMQI